MHKWFSYFFVVASYFHSLSYSARIFCHKYSTEKKCEKEKINKKMKVRKCAVNTERNMIFYVSRVIARGIAKKMA